MEAKGLLWAGEGSTDGEERHLANNSVQVLGLEVSPAGLSLTHDITSSLPPPTETTLPFRWRRSLNIRLDGLE